MQNTYLNTNKNVILKNSRKSIDDSCYFCYAIYCNSTAGGEVLKLEKIGKVTHGATLSRIKPEKDEEKIAYELFTMQDLSKESGQYGIVSEKQEAYVRKKKFDEELLSKEGNVIVGLTSYKAIVVEKEHAGKIITSNFAYIEIDEKKIDPYYFTWCFNEHPEIQKQLIIATQGSIIRAISIQMLRELKILLPAMEIQRKIGKVYELKKRKEKLLFEKNVLEEKLYRHLIVEKLKEDIKCH